MFGLIRCFVLFCLVFSLCFVFISNVAGTRRHESQAVTPLFLLFYCPIDLLRVLQICLI
jgi:hypothetical protein